MTKHEENSSVSGVGSTDGLGVRCPYLLVAAPDALCVWSGKRDPKGCSDGLVRFFRIGRGEIFNGKMLCRLTPN